jgi:hypothetical protein
MAGTDQEDRIAVSAFHGPAERLLSRAGLEAHGAHRAWNRFVHTARELGTPETLEADGYERTVKEIRAARPVPKGPAVVLTSDHPFDFGAGGRGTWHAWLAAQNRLAASLDAQHVTDTDSGHYIAGERPGFGRRRDPTSLVALVTWPWSGCGG